MLLLDLAAVRLAFIHTRQRNFTRYLGINVERLDFVQSFLWARRGRTMRVRLEVTTCRRIGSWTFELVAHTRQHVEPVAAADLLEQAHGGIPQRMAVFHMPQPPGGREPSDTPDWACERTG
jgi:hypothetical protein